MAVEETLAKMGFGIFPIEKLVKADWNYKENDAALSESLAANLKRNGQVENLLVRELNTGFYEVVNGNHRYDALVELEFKNVIVKNLGKITQANAMRIAIETNETRFKTDSVKMAGLFQEISSEFDIIDLAATMPFTAEEIEDYGKMLDFDWDSFGQSTDQFGENESGSDKPRGSVQATCPNCNRRFNVEFEGN